MNRDSCRLRHYSALLEQKLLGIGREDLAREAADATADFMAGSASGSTASTASTGKGTAAPPPLLVSPSHTAATGVTTPLPIMSPSLRASMRAAMTSPNGVVTSPKPVPHAGVTPAPATDGEQAQPAPSTARRQHRSLRFADEEGEGEQEQEAVAQDVHVEASTQQAQPPASGEASGYIASQEEAAVSGAAPVATSAPSFNPGDHVDVEDLLAAADQFLLELQQVQSEVQRALSGDASTVGGLGGSIPYAIGSSHSLIYLLAQSLVSATNAADAFQAEATRLRESLSLERRVRENLQIGESRFIAECAAMSRLLADAMADAEAADAAKADAEARCRALSAQLDALRLQSSPTAAALLPSLLVQAAVDRDAAIQLLESLTSVPPAAQAVVEFAASAAAEGRAVATAEAAAEAPAVDFSSALEPLEAEAASEAAQMPFEAPAPAPEQKNSTAETAVASIANQEAAVDAPASPAAAAAPPAAEEVEAPASPCMRTSASIAGSPAPSVLFLSPSVRGSPAGSDDMLASGPLASTAGGAGSCEGDGSAGASSAEHGDGQGGGGFISPACAVSTPRSLGSLMAHSGPGITIDGEGSTSGSYGLELQFSSPPPLLVGAAIDMLRTIASGASARTLTGLGSTARLQQLAQRYIMGSGRSNRSGYGLGGAPGSASSALGLNSTAGSAGIDLLGIASAMSRRSRTMRDREIYGSGYTATNASVRSAYSDRVPAAPSFGSPHQGNNTSSSSIAIDGAASSPVSGLVLPSSTSPYSTASLGAAARDGLTSPSSVDLTSSSSPSMASSSSGYTLAQTAVIMHATAGLTMMRDHMMMMMGATGGSSSASSDGGSALSSTASNMASTTGSTDLALLFSSPLPTAKLPGAYPASGVSIISVGSSASPTMVRMAADQTMMTTAAETGPSTPAAFAPLTPLAEEASGPGPSGSNGLFFGSPGGMGSPRSAMIRRGSVGVFSPSRDKAYADRIADIEEGLAAAIAAADEALREVKAASSTEMSSPIESTSAAAGAASSVPQQQQQQLQQADEPKAAAAAVCAVLGVPKSYRTRYGLSTTGARRMSVDGSEVPETAAPIVAKAPVPSAAGAASAIGGGKVVRGARPLPPRAAGPKPASFHAAPATAARVSVPAVGGNRLVAAAPPSTIARRRSSECDTSVYLQSPAQCAAPSTGVGGEVPHVTESAEAAVRVRGFSFSGANMEHNSAAPQHCSRANSKVAVTTTAATPAHRRGSNSFIKAASKPAAAAIEATSPLSVIAAPLEEFLSDRASASPPAVVAAAAPVPQAAPAAAEESVTTSAAAGPDVESILLMRCASDASLTSEDVACSPKHLPSPEHPAGEAPSAALAVTSDATPVAAAMSAADEEAVFGGHGPVESRLVSRLLAAKTPAHSTRPMPHVLSQAEHAVSCAPAMRPTDKSSADLVFEVESRGLTAPPPLCACLDPTKSSSSSGKASGAFGPKRGSSSSSSVLLLSFFGGGSSAPSDDHYCAGCDVKIKSAGASHSHCSNCSGLFCEFL